MCRYALQRGGNLGGCEGPLGVREEVPDHDEPRFGVSAGAVHVVDPPDLDFPALVTSRSSIGEGLGDGDFVFRELDAFLAAGFSSILFN